VTSGSGIRVIKLGGSLLKLPGLGERLKTWLARQSPARNVIVVGGGPFVDELRALDQAHHLGDEACHWLAIRAMSLTARLLHALLGEWKLVTHLNELSEPDGGPTIVDPWHFLRSDEASLAGPKLPHSWAVTSDSIAARLASRLAAEELVLLKSCLPPGDVRHSTEGPYVDDYFRAAARGLAVRCVNLRDTDWPERRLDVS
jgi:aspartokinase-like uncharacterized kinase